MSWCTSAGTARSKLIRGPSRAANLKVDSNRYSPNAPTGVLFVDAANDLDFAELAGVIDTARGAGVVRIGLLTEQQK
jgi:biopolymer transport protein ExbD